MQTSSSKSSAFSFPQTREELFYEIMKLYDFADELLKAVEHEGVVNRAEQAAIAAPFVEEVTKTADALAAIYSQVVNELRPITPELQQHVEQIFKNFYRVLHIAVDEMERDLLPSEKKI